MDDKDYESDSTVRVEDLSKNPEKVARKRRRLDAAIRRTARTNIHESDVENTTPNVPNANLPIDDDRNNDPDRDWIMKKYFDSSNNNNNDSTAEEDLKIKRELLKDEYDRVDDEGNYDKDDDDVANDCIVISDDSDDDCAIVTNELSKQVDENTSPNPRISVLTPSAINNRRATLDTLESNENASNVNSVNLAYPNKVNPKLTVLKPAAINARRSTFTCFERNVAAIKKTVQDNVTKCDNFTSNKNKNKEINHNNKTKETSTKHVNETNWLSGQKNYGERLTKLNKNKTSGKRNIDCVIQGLKDSQAKKTVLLPKNNDINNKDKAGVIKTANRNKSTDSSDVMRSQVDVLARNNQGSGKFQERVDTGDINSKDPSRTDAGNDKTVKMNGIVEVGKGVNVTKTNNINSGNDDINKNKETTNQVKDQTDSAKKPEVIGVFDRSKTEKEKSHKRSKSIDAKRDAVDRCVLNTDFSYGNVSNTDDVENPSLQKLEKIIQQNNKTDIVQAENTNELDNEQSNRGPDSCEKIDSNKINETNNREKKVRFDNNRFALPSSGNINVAINTDAPVKSTAKKSTCNMSVKSKKHEVTNLVADDVITKSNTLTNKTTISANNDVSTKTSENQNKKLTTRIEKSQQSCSTMSNKKDENKSHDKINSYKRKVQDNTSPIKPKQVRTNAIEQDEITKITGICNNQTELNSITAVPSNLLMELLTSNNSGNNMSNSDTTYNTEGIPNCNETASVDNNGTNTDEHNSKAQITRNQVESFTEDKDTRNTSKEKLDAPLTDAKAAFFKNKNKDDCIKTAVAQYTCSICSCVFDSHASLHDHVNNSHSIPEKSKEVCCPLCNFTMTQENYMEHGKEHEPDDTEVVGGNIASEITTNKNINDATQQQNSEISYPLCNVPLTEANYMEKAKEHDHDDTEVVGGNIASEITTNKNITDATHQQNSEISYPLCNVPLTEENYMEHAKEHDPDDAEVVGGKISTEMSTNNRNVKNKQQTKAVATSSDEKQYECRICKEIIPSSAKEKHKKQEHGHLDYKNMQLFKATKNKVNEPKQANVVIQSSACREDEVSALSNPTLGSKEKKSYEDLENKMNSREENRKNEFKKVAAKTGNDFRKDKNVEQNINDGTDQINAQNLNANYDTQKKTNQERKRKADDEHINIIQEAKQAHVAESPTEKTMYKYKCVICKTLFTDNESRKHRKEHPDFANKHLFDTIKINADGQIDEQNRNEVDEEIRKNEDEISPPNHTIVDAHETTKSQKISGGVENVKQSDEASVNDSIPTNYEMESEPLTLNETNTFDGGNVGAESNSQLEFHETRTLGDNNDLNTDSTEDSTRENISDHAHPENSSVSGSDADVSQNVDDTADTQIEDEVSREQPKSKYIYPSKSERNPPLANCYKCWTNIEVNDINNHDCRQKIVGNLYNCFSCGVNIQRDDMHQCENGNIQITNIVTVNEVYVFNCKDCNSATDVYDDIIRHCQNHYNGKMDPVVSCETCQLSYNVDSVKAHEHLHGKEVTIINYSYKSLFSNWDETFDGIPAHVVKEMQLRSIYRSHCVKMMIITEGPWEYSLYQCKQCETCVPPSKIDQHCQEQCSSVAYPCSICDKLFTSEAMCSNHELDHRATKLFKVIEFNCKKDERFNRKLFEARKMEIASRIHIADIFKCQCGLCFTSNETFRKHFACCDSESDKGTICHRCVAPRIFEPNDLEIHLSLHHSSVDYRFRVNSIVIQQEIETFDVLDGENCRPTQDGSAENDIKVESLKVDIQERTV